jgi:signal transduction histidine kinase
MRIAVLSWLIALFTLFIFAAVTVPHQKSFFLSNLESRANSVAVSLHDATAGAALNEDYASVVLAAQGLIAGGAKIDFLIIMKNEGFALIVEENGWRMESEIDSFWRPSIRSPFSGIAKVPLFDRRVYYFGQPFDYSGIQWGWIHVGLSLSDYDQNVELLYRNTFMLALACIVFSLLVSFGYAGQLVRPVQRLRQIVQQIAGGDLSVRAEVIRHDELGSLAQSVNTMTDALVRRNRILESVRYSAEQFVRGERWETVIISILDRIGNALDGSRAYIFQIHAHEVDRPTWSLRFEWTAPGMVSHLNHPRLRNFAYSNNFDYLFNLLSQKAIYAGSVADLPYPERSELESLDIRSLVVIPIFVEDTWWGILGLVDCEKERLWSDAEIDSLKAGAQMFGATVARQKAQNALLEAKNTLEMRVQERTQQLQDQVAAKEQALTQLAAAQSTMLEMSRAAGMAEVATGVLHNVGNVLNSVNVSCTLIIDQLQQSRIVNLSKVAAMMAAPEGGLMHFLTQDPRGKQVPGYLANLAPALEEEHRSLLDETVSLRDRIDHIKEIVAMQQSYGRVSGVKVTVTPEQLMEDALVFNAGALTRHGITVHRHYDPVSTLNVDKHKVLQILLNLITNAKYACSKTKNVDKTITLRIYSPTNDRVCLQIRDNGMGISPENMGRIFRHGFTTRAKGHGFGLHSGALAAAEMGGKLTCHSDGVGCGATFTLELPNRSGDEK